jgi:hypothetical protein
VLKPGSVIAPMWNNITEYCESIVRRLLRKCEFWSLSLLCRYFSRPVRTRSLWAGTPILTLPIKARAETLLGIHADTLVYDTYFITRDFKYDLTPWFRGTYDWWKTLGSHMVLAWACLRYQRFHYFCDRGLLPAAHLSYELDLLRYLGKEVFFYAYGADVRTAERTKAMGDPNCCSECPAPGDACVCSEQVGREKYALVSHYANAVFSMGDMIEFTPGSRNDLFYWPIDLDRDHGRRYAPRYPDPASNRPIRVVHAPNHRGFKGSRYIIEIVSRLQAENLPIELVLVEGIPNDQALDIYREADIVFDQCLIGFHGYFALEALALGKPVMVFIRDPQRYLLAPEECPFINSPPSRIERILRELISNRSLLRDLGMKGRRYIEKHFALGVFASRLKRAYQELGLVAGLRALNHSKMEQGWQHPPLSKAA